MDDDTDFQSVVVAALTAYLKGGETK